MQVGFVFFFDGCVVDFFFNLVVRCWKGLKSLSLPAWMLYLKNNYLSIL